VDYYDAASSKPAGGGVGSEEEADLAGDGGLFGVEGVQAPPAGSPDLFRRSVDHLLVPFAKTFHEAGYRFRTDSFAAVYGLTPEQAQVVRESFYPVTPRKLAATFQ
jgi:hypothetical protein